MSDLRSKTVIIVGGGAFGLSTALHLTEEGYRDVTVLERDSQVPPRYSAANDLNKIVRAEYEDPFYTDLTLVCSLFRIFIDIILALSRKIANNDPT